MHGGLFVLCDFPAGYSGVGASCAASDRMVEDNLSQGRTAAVPTATVPRRGATGVAEQHRTRDHGCNHERAVPR